jgi:hypothetical protein
VIFAPPRTRGAAVLGALAVAAAVFGAALLVRGLGLRVSFSQFLSYTFAATLLAAAVPLGYWFYAVSSLHYELRGGSLIVHWGLAERVIPVGSIQRVVLGRNLPLPTVTGLRLPGVAVGRAHVSRVGAASVYLRYRRAEDLIYLFTEDGAVGLSVGEAQPFVRALQQAQAEAVARPVRGELRRGALLRLGLPAERRALICAGAGAFLAWLSAAVVYARFQGRPPAVTLHFPPTEAAHLAPRGDLLHIPESAVVWCAVATILALLVFNRSRIAAYMLLAASAMSGAIFLVAAIGAVG